MLANSQLPPWPSFTLEEADAVSRTLLSNKVNYWTGNECREFEKEFATWCGTEYAVALANGTVALDVALKALNIGQGDEVIVTSRTFLASVSCIVTAGAIPVFADIDRNSQNITADTIAPMISNRTRAIICVHLAGWPCEMDAIMALAAKHNLYVIEDCAQAHGAVYKGQMVGSIEGGMVTTNDHALWSKMWSYKDHGKSWEAVYEREQTPGFNWLHESFGTNWRMLEIQAVIGRIQLRRMPEWSEKRRDHANRIWQTAKSLKGLRVPDIPAHIVHAAYKCYVFIEPEQLKPDWNRNRIIAEINQQGVPCFSGSCSEVYLEKAFDNTGWRPEHRLPVAKELGETSLMFLVHPTLTLEAINKTCNALKDVMNQATALKQEI